MTPPPSPVAASASEWSPHLDRVAASASEWSARVSDSPRGTGVSPVLSVFNLPPSTARAPLGAFRHPIALRFFAPFCGQKFRPFGFLLLLASLACLTSHAAPPAAALPPEQIEFFETTIRPILVESCYKCHSEAEGKSKGSLTLDTRDALLKGGATGPALVAGDPDKSLLIQAVRYTDEDLQMPPAKTAADGSVTGGKLSSEKIAALETWIRLGAPDPRTGPVTPAALDMARARQHWAFQPLPKIPDPSPQIPDPKSQTPPLVDSLVLPKLTAARLTPAPAADPRTLLRRITYDLTGLPPTSEEMESFLREFPSVSPSPTLSISPSSAPDPAYARAIDRLLASPRYGERWGRFWLDVARYADTQGYLVGNAERRFAFSHTYRDYVIRAFNTDLPFDRFIVEQLAADQLPLGDDQSALAAMGFLTLGRRFLGKQDDIIDDRIDVVTRGLLGLTVACARCHDHKFDPIPTRDYYALHGMFASSEEPTEKPLLAKLDDTAPAYREFLRKRAELAAAIEAKKHELVDTFLADQRKKTGDYLLGAHDAATLAPDEKFDLFAGTRKLNPEILKRWQKYLADHAASPGPILAPWFAFLAGSARLQPASLDTPDPLKPSSSPDGPTAPSATPPDLLAHLAPPHTSTDAPFVAPENAHPALLAALREKPPASLADLATLYNRVFTAAEKSRGTGVPTVISASPIENPKSEIENFSAAPAATEKTVGQALRLLSPAPADLSYEAAAKIIKRQLDDKTSALRREVEALNWTEPGAPLRAMALVDKKSPQNSPIYLRGNPAHKGPEAPRRFLEVLSPPDVQRSTLSAQRPSPTSSGRLELAQAITGTAAPLTARVIVNRVWGWHFGQALVRTPSDFGVRTESPVQRDLLDALAAQFVADGWSLKKLHRTILLSATYRQSSLASSATLAADPDNQLLSRFNRRRLEFEALRDTLLVASGQLDLTPGGLPDDLIKEPFTHRRTVYGFIDRQNLPGLFRTFDFPSPDTSSAQRFATTVPQQSLFLLNSPFAQAQARALATRSELTSAPTDPEKIRALYTTLFQRPPDADELALAQTFLTTTASGSTATSGSQLSALNSQLLPAPSTSHLTLSTGAALAGAASPGWHYGYGAFDPATQRTSNFTPLTHRTFGTGKQKDQATRLAATAAFPDPTFGHLSLTPTGGHPGNSPAHAAILRWIAPATGIVQIKATLAHPTAQGDGLHARIVSSRTGSLGEWPVHNSKAETKFADLRVTAGETLDFLVAPSANPTSDGYTWSPKIQFMSNPDAPSRTWDAQRDFGTVEKPAIPLPPLAALAQVLLLSNELAFVD